jgi:hypothetical protein
MLQLPTAVHNGTKGLIAEGSGMSVNLKRLLAIGVATGLGQVSLAQVPSIAFVDVTVIAMDGQRTSAHQTVVTRAGSIAEVGPATAVKVPSGSQTIDGRNRYLMPGLADMQAHFLRPPNGGKHDLDFERYLQYNELFALLEIANAREFERVRFRVRPSIQLDLSRTENHLP